MKILLVGEAHNVHHDLSLGLRALGHEAVLVISQQTNVPLPRDAIDLYSILGGNRLERYVRPLSQLYFAATLRQVDVVSFMHRISLVNRSFLRYSDIAMLRRSTDILSYTALGCDEIALIVKNQNLPYRPCESCEREDIAGRMCVDSTRKAHERGKTLLNRYFDTAASISVEYDHALGNFAGRKARIPLPVNVKEIQWRPARSNRAKARILHTPTREGFKGTSVVLEAIGRLERIRRDFEFELVSGLGWIDYWNRVGDADIVIDQVWSQWAGTNALRLLAMGKVVLSGNTPLGAAYFPFGNQSPIFDAPPDAGQLAQVLGDVLDGRSRFGEFAERGREFVGEHHDHVKVANAFLRLWKPPARF